METLFGLFAMAVFAVGIIGWLWIAVMAFNEGEVLWGLGCLIISPLCIVYAILNFEELKIPLFMVCGGFVGNIALVLIGSAMG